MQCKNDAKTMQKLCKNYAKAAFRKFQTNVKNISKFQTHGKNIFLHHIWMICASFLHSFWMCFWVMFARVVSDVCNGFWMIFCDFLRILVVFVWSMAGFLHILEVMFFYLFFCCFRTRNEYCGPEGGLAAILGHLWIFSKNVFLWIFCAFFRHPRKKNLHNGGIRSVFCASFWLSPKILCFHECK